MNFCRGRGTIRDPRKAELLYPARADLTAWSCVGFRQTPAMDNDERDENGPRRTFHPFLLRRNRKLHRAIEGA
jgi:hypothetical protein